ncbi:TonB-dependent receptor [Sphingobium jiangsuense]|uniref:Iron complex outermembrane receptor protein n=1 Tax=Sphingobium jiangsuense TaxID=870476 RepID=A0A7W6BLG5_9SPHN|nr:TonB-dependent receptor [Sphingobium jiangsuense]MBB3925930.1 iron complex outermembrane receptor protein [Sphingobium jiangsuense]GLS98646.1 TonB-dependent receptor [Sphingobium jiangsuense]
MRIRTILLSSCLVTAGLYADHAAAQVAEQGAVSATEIIVTARRREESIQDVPISVSAISGEQLQKSGVTDVQGLQYRTPSLSITSAQSQRNTVAFSLRGQRTQETQLFTDPPVGTYFAEVVQPRPYGFGKSFFDLESVQVLKGVQGTLFGRNMTGGAVLVEPAHPRLGEFAGEVRGQYGNYDMYDVYGMVNVPLGDKIALRFSGKTHERDGWAREVTTGRRYDNQNYDTFRVSALVEPVEGLESLTVFDWYKSSETGTAAFLTSTRFPSVLSNYANLYLGGLIDGNITAQIAEAQELFRNKRFTFNLGAGEGGNLDVFGAPYEDIKNWGITNKTTWELSDNLTIKNIFGYRKVRRDMVQDYDGIPLFLITPYQYSRSRNISEEFQIQGKAFDRKLDYILGVYYFEEKGIDGSLANTLPELNIVGAGLNARTTDGALFVTANPGEGYSRTAAAFIAGTLHVTDQLSLSGGLRYNYDKRKITVSPSMPNIVNGDGSVGRCSFDIDAATAGTQTVPFDQCRFTNQKTFKEWTYDATVQYEPSEQVTAYASYRHGFRAGGFSTRATSYVTLAPFLPEFVDEYEIGLKTNTPLGAGRLTTSTALFRQDGSNVQKQRATFVNGNVFTIVDNTAKQRNTGGEFEATFNTEGFSLTGFYSYTKVKVLEGGATSAIGPEIAQRGVPKHQLGATAVISPPLDPNTGELNFVLNYTWRSANYLDDFEREGRQAPYSLVNLRAELNDIGRSGISVAAFVNNALDETYRIGVLGLIAEGLGFQSSVYGEPRTYGLEVGFRF